MVIDFDKRKDITIDQKLRSLADSVQMAIEEISPSSQGASGIKVDYNNLLNKPSIESVTLVGNKTFEDLNLNALTNSEIQDILDNLII